MVGFVCKGICAIDQFCPSSVKISRVGVLAVLKDFAQGVLEPLLSKSVAMPYTTTWLGLEPRR